MWTLSDIHSLTPLLNSLFFEWKNYTLEWPFITLLTHEKCLRIELKKFSKIGHHQYTGNIYLDDKHLSFDEFIYELTNILNLDHKDSFIERINQSRSSIEEALRVNINHFVKIVPNFKHSETSLFIGHSLHPTPKSRTEFNRDDLLRYSPEHGGKFKVSWFKVHKSIFFKNYSRYFQDVFWATRVSEIDNDSDYELLPIHPWQKKHILKIDIIERYLREGLIQDLGESGPEWYPTSSLRTLYHERSPYMIKFSLDLKMTNSIRHLLPHELERGIQIDDVTHHPFLESFFKEFNDFKIIQEPYYAGIIDEAGKVIAQSLIMLRENIFEENDEVSLLAVLTQPHAKDERGLLSELIINSKLSPNEWFKEFLKKAIAPIIILEGKYGVLLGAHQQNLILKLENGKPSGAYFRDCHGTGFDAKKISHLRSEILSIQDENGNVLEQEVSHYLFAYYLVINSVFNMISAISHQTVLDENDLLVIYRDFLIELKLIEDLDLSFIDYLLYSPHLMHKGNFFCTTKNINENTTKNPLEIYTKIPNPLKEFSNA